MSRPIVRAIVLAAVALLAAPIGFASPNEGSSSSALCPAGLRSVDDVGLACPREDGLLEVFTPELESLGTIHGSDPVPEGEALPGGPALAVDAEPKCVSGASGTYYIQVIYARASDDVDGYAFWLEGIRDMVRGANQLVMNAAVATGSTALLNVKCVEGVIEVKNEALPTSMLSASFSTITNDLRQRGYNDAKVKYWVFYDDTGACSCGGQGNVYNDDRLIVGNNNNGNAGPMYSITYGYDSVRIMLHELGHNLGAVQQSAPYQSGGWHCNDGRDTMCYADGGSNSSYSTGYCAVEVWDCNKNTYFHASPPAGSYLATKWNIGNAINRFMTFGVPSVTELSCTANVELGSAATCSFVAQDDSSGVRYSLDWGDGSSETIPASGYVAPGLVQAASHTYAANGTYTVTVGVVDAGGAVGSSRNATLKVWADLVPPELEVFDPRPDTIYQGCAAATTSPVHIIRPIWVGTACIRVDATDARSGVDRVEVWVGGGLRAVDRDPPYELEFPVPQPALNMPAMVIAYDREGNYASVAVAVDMLPLPE